MRFQELKQEPFSRRNPPVEVPQDTGAVLADTDEDAVGFAHKQAGDLPRVPVQVNLRLHLHLRGLWGFDTRTHEDSSSKTKTRRGQNTCV